MQTNQDYSNCVFQDVENLMDWWENVECKSGVECLLLFNSIFRFKQLLLYIVESSHKTLLTPVNVYFILKAKVLGLFINCIPQHKNHIQIFML